MNTGSVICDCISVFHAELQCEFATARAAQKKVYSIVCVLFGTRRKQFALNVLQWYTLFALACMHARDSCFSGTFD